MNALFICSQNKLRSPTAEHIFAKWPNIETDSAGLNNDAETTLTPEQIDWADLIFVMEKAHRNRLTHKFKKHLKNKRVICLDIPDEYEYMDANLVRLLEVRAGRFLR
ncbi:MAG: low molecular weight protein tyrosine phosphatase family protein [Pseudomonadota bacterium]|nr:low molecular weight protein tyrosine phosphatase family protein [Pseudomonadota bacterium]